VASNAFLSYNHSFTGTETNSVMTEYLFKLMCQYSKAVRRSADHTVWYYISGYNPQISVTKLLRYVALKNISLKPDCLRCTLYESSCTLTTHAHWTCVRFSFSAWFYKSRLLAAASVYCLWVRQEVSVSRRER